MRERLVEIVAEELRRYQEPPTAQELGLLGKLFGGRSADTYIAGVVVVLAFLLLAATLVLDATTGPLEHRRDFVTGSFSLVSLALGYVFGAYRR